MSTLTKRISLEELKTTFKQYDLGLLNKDIVYRQLNIKERRFYSLLKLYRTNRLKSLYNNKRGKNRALSILVDAKIRDQLTEQRQLILNRDIPIKTYNFTYLRDTLAKNKINVSVTTIANRARLWGYTKAVPKRTDKHTRVVLTDAIGILLQHDASQHLWAPIAHAKWYLITTIDDYSRKILYADFVEHETTWAHMIAAKKVALKYGINGTYYTDQHSIFKYIDNRDAYINTASSAKAIKTQWSAMLQRAGCNVIHAFSPEAKGKVERPFSWLQDHIVRECYSKNINNITDARSILKQMVYRYNHVLIHSTTGEIPDIRFSKAIKQHKTVLKPLPEDKRTITGLDSIFHIEETRIADNYGRLKLNQSFLIGRYRPNVTYSLWIIPDTIRPRIHVVLNGSITATINLLPNQGCNLVGLTKHQDKSSRGGSDRQKK